MLNTDHRFGVKSKNSVKTGFTATYPRNCITVFFFSLPLYQTNSIAMETLVVTVKDKHEMQLVSDVLKKMRINAKQLTKEEREDLGLSKLMKQANRSEKVSREQVMKSLSGE